MITIYKEVKKIKEGFYEATRGKETCSLRCIDVRNDIFVNILSGDHGKSCVDRDTDDGSST